MNNEQEMILKGRINNFKSRVNMGNEKTFGYETLKELVDLGQYIEKLIPDLSDAELQSADLLFRSAEVINNPFSEEGKKDQEQRLRELNVLQNTLNQMIHYYEQHRGYNQEKNESEKIENQIGNEYDSQLILINQIKQYLVYCKELANNNPDFSDMQKITTVAEYNQLIEYVNMLENYTQAKKEENLNNSDSASIDEISDIVNEYIKALNNSDELFALKANTFVIKVKIENLHKTLNQQSGLKM